MKFLSIISAVMMLMTVSCSSNKYDNKRTDIERQEAMDMIKNSDDIEIKKGWGNDKIILKDQ